MANSTIYQHVSYDVYIVAVISKPQYFPLKGTSCPLNCVNISLQLSHQEYFDVSPTFTH